MTHLTDTDRALLREIADISDIPEGAYNIRKDGAGIARHSSDNIQIIPKTDNPGIDIRIAPGTKGEVVHIPVIITHTGINDKVYNTFDIGENADVTIVAGCGIHNDGDSLSRHDGIHTFFVRKGARVKYVEKHYGEGGGSGERVLNPETIVHLEEGSYCEMEMVQIAGVDSTRRVTKASLMGDAQLLLVEKLLTDGRQVAESDMEVSADGPGARVQIISRTVAQGVSKQIFYPRVIGNAPCRAHIQCDSILMDNASVRSIPEITANHPDAELIHEAAIGKIAGDQILKLLTLGYEPEEAEEKILEGFLR